MSKKKNKSPKALFVFKMLIFLFCVYASLSIIKIQTDINGKKQELAEIDKKIEAISEENEIYGHYLEMQNDDDYIEHIAKEKLGYGYPDERVYFDVSCG